LLICVFTATGEQGQRTKLMRIQKSGQQMTAPASGPCISRFSDLKAGFFVFSIRNNLKSKKDSDTDKNGLHRCCYAAK